MNAFANITPSEWKRLDAILAKSTYENKEMAIFLMNDGGWSIEVGNTCIHVMLGESSGYFSAVGETFKECLFKLEQQVR